MGDTNLTKERLLEVPPAEHRIRLRTFVPFCDSDSIKMQMEIHAHEQMVIAHQQVSFFWHCACLDSHAPTSA